jgi:glycerol-3-phosphate acyltransferase PlsY
MGLVNSYAVPIFSGYLSGNLVFAYILGKLIKKSDIRLKGDGNPGALNSVQVFGWPLAITVLLMDIVKTALPILIGKFLFGWNSTEILIAGLGVIIGHCFPFWMKFRGGRGTASMVAVLALIDIRIAAVVVITMLGIAFTTNKGPLGAVIAYALIPLMFLFTRRLPVEIIISIAIAIILEIVQMPLFFKMLRGELNPVFKTLSGPPSEEEGDGGAMQYDRGKGN